MYAIIDIHVVSLFSFRTLHTNAHSARTLPCPTPAGVKLAILARLLDQPGLQRDPQALLDWLAPLAVWWRPPARLAVSTATVRTYKADGPDRSLTMSRGMREYAHLSDEFGLALGPVPYDQRDLLTAALARIRALGTADSLVQPLGPPRWEDTPPTGFVNLSGTSTTGEADAPRVTGNEVAAVLDDLGPAPDWTRLNVYRPPARATIPRLGEDRVRRIVTLPLRVARWRQAGYVLERLMP